jgi:hypothetical protein
MGRPVSLRVGAVLVSAAFDRPASRAVKRGTGAEMVLVQKVHRAG